MNLRSVSDIIQNGGTALFTARSPAFMTEEGKSKPSIHVKSLILMELLLLVEMVLFVEHRLYVKGILV